MLKYCLKKWDENKGLLEERLKTDTSLNDCDYEYLVKMVVECVLNQGDEVHEWDSKHITVIDNGDYQGTLLFMIPLDVYQPSEYEYLMTCVGYGSCSGCDTLQSIQEYDTRPPTASQLKDYMALCKDIVANMIKPYNGGWRLDEEFETVEFDKNDFKE
jgi:hypothetical protein